MIGIALIYTATTGLKSNNMKHRTFPFTDKIYQWLSPKYFGVEADTKQIKKMLESDKPCMISRFGSTELQTLSYVRFYPFSLPLKKRTYFNIQYASGFFPVTFQNLKKFYRLYKDDAKIMDMLVSWRIEETLFKDWLGNLIQVKKTTFDTFYTHEHPWTYVLKGKKVLVVHPFAETIENQYRSHRTDLFANEEILPEFASLTTVKAVQSIAGNPVGFDDWFNALEWMKSEIGKKDYDIALLGCGAYAMPLAAYIKRNGKKAVHMGGVLQFLFGIKSIRYEDNLISAPYINQYFVYPSDADKPKNANLVEGGCYWGK